MKKSSDRGLEFPPLVLGSNPKLESDAPAVEAAGFDPSSEPTPDGVEAMFQPQRETEKPVRRRFAPFRVDPELEPLELIEVEDSAKGKPPKIKAAKPEKSPKAAKAPKLVNAQPDQPLPAIDPEVAAGPAPQRLPFWARHAYLAAITLAVLWSGCMIAFTQGYQFHDGPFSIPNFPPVVIGLLALLPATFILLSAYVLRQAARLSMETARARALADELAIPAALAVDQAGGAAQAVRREVARAAEAGEAAQQQLTSLRAALAEESDRLVAATAEAERAARSLTESLSRERGEMEALTSSLDAKVGSVNDAIERQTRLVTETSDLAAAQLQEAEAMLAARATGLATAAGEAGEAAELAGEALARQADRLESVGELVGAKLSGLSDDLGRGHSRLADLAVQLQADQQSLTARLDAQRQSAVIAAAEAQQTMESANGAAESVAGSLRQLIAEADERLRSLADSVQGEQAALDARARAALSLFRDAVTEERQGIEAEANAALASLHETAAASRDVAASGAEAARIQVEQLGEAAFAAGQKADQAFDARITAARRAIEQSATLLEDAGQRSVERIDAGLSAARNALAEIEQTLASVDERIGAAPEQARAQAAAIRDAVESGLQEVAASARKIAAETEAVDTALQQRVRRNYEMLSEALKTMGKVATVTEQAAARSAQQAVQSAPLAAPAPIPTPRPVAPPQVAFADRAIRVPLSEPPPALEPIRAAALSSSDIGLRPRLRLTPETIAPPTPPVPERKPPVVHETLDAFQRPPLPKAPAYEPPGGGNWTWKDLLSGIDEPPIDDEVLAERLISEIEALGLDVATLLPLARIDEIASAVQRGDHAQARDAVRGLAPGAVRRLSRRVLTDKVLRAQADRYVQRYEDLLNDSAKRDRDGFMTSALLGSEPGRAFLLFDAAVGELH